MSESRSGWAYIFMGSLMLIYLLGAAMIGQLGFAIVLGHLTAIATHMSLDASEALWTGVYIVATLMILGTGIYLETSK